MGVQVSREPPPLPGGFVLGEKVYYTGPSETFEDPSETFVLEHGAQGEVVGRVRAGGHMFEGVAVRFPGSKYLIPTVLYPCEPTLPSLPGGYTVGEQVTPALPHLTPRWLRWSRWTGRRRNGWVALE